MVLIGIMTQVTVKVQTQPDRGGSKRSGEARRQARTTKGSGNGSRRQASSLKALTAQEAAAAMWARRAEAKRTLGSTLICDYGALVITNQGDPMLLVTMTLDMPKWPQIQFGRSRLSLHLVVSASISISVILRLSHAITHHYWKPDFL